MLCCSNPSLGFELILSACLADLLCTDFVRMKDTCHKALAPAKSCKDRTCMGVSGAGPVLLDNGDRGAEGPGSVFSDLHGRCSVRDDEGIRLFFQMAIKTTVQRFVLSSVQVKNRTAGEEEFKDVFVQVRDPWSRGKEEPDTFFCKALCGGGEDAALVRFNVDAGEVKICVVFRVRVIEQIFREIVLGAVDGKKGPVTLRSHKAEACPVLPGNIDRSDVKALQVISHEVPEGSAALWCQEGKGDSLDFQDLCGISRTAAGGQDHVTGVDVLFLFRQVVDVDVDVHAGRARKEHLPLCFLFCFFHWGCLVCSQRIGTSRCSTEVEKTMRVLVFPKCWSSLMK